MTAHETAGERQAPGHEPQQRPKGLGPGVESAEMHAREPGKKRVSKSDLRGPFAIQEVDEIVEGLREAKIDSRDSPHHQKQETPESQQVVQVPIDSRETRSPIHAKAAAPVRDARPPYDHSGQT